MLKTIRRPIWTPHILGHLSIPYATVKHTPLDKLAVFTTKNPSTLQISNILYLSNQAFKPLNSYTGFTSEARWPHTSRDVAIWNTCAIGNTSLGF